MKCVVTNDNKISLPERESCNRYYGSRVRTDSKFCASLITSRFETVLD